MEILDHMNQMLKMMMHSSHGELSIRYTENDWNILMSIITVSDEVATSSEGRREDGQVISIRDGRE